MLTTIELRWFQRGALPKEVSQWFQQDYFGEQQAPAEEREDVYLYLPDCDYLGMKLRQGRLEIKWRRAELGVLHFEDKVQGKIEKWAKWMCEDPTNEIFNSADVVNKQWVSVKKVRSQRRFQVLPDKTIISVPVSESIEQGCNFEITELNINSNSWWSLAFEAFGNDCLVEHLQAASSWVFKSDIELKLLPEDSYAYPSWLTVAV